MDNKITAVQARQISEANVANNFLVKSNIDYILERVIKEANKGELHLYVAGDKLGGNEFIIQQTFIELRKLGYTAFNISSDNDNMYKIAW